MTRTRRDKIFDMTKGRCAYCGISLRFDTFHIEHMIPRTRGGRNALVNIVPSCKECNQSKSKRTVPEFRQWIKDGGKGGIDAANAFAEMAKFYEWVTPMLAPGIPEELAACLTSIANDLTEFFHIMDKGSIEFTMDTMENIDDQF